jgi:hypothetical protein
MLKSGFKYFLFIGLAISVFIASCDKDYSYEGGATLPQPITVPLPVDTLKTDTIVANPGDLPVCKLCIDTGEIKESTWSFKAGNSFICGIIDTAIILNLGRSSLTFFGPAACGSDTGLIFTVHLGANGLNKDLQNIDATNAIFYYYHTGSFNIFSSHADQSFKLTIVNYNHLTKMLIGTFSGTAYRQDGRSVIVTEGKFKLKML